ncbi:C39 family peptidase [Peptoanaerobacter stomatis]
MPVFIALSKTLLKKIALNIVFNDKKSDDLTPVFIGVFITIFLLPIIMFAYIAITPVSILFNFFSGVSFDTVVNIKSDNGYMQEQDKEFIKNKGIEHTYTDENGDTHTYETDEYSDVFIENGSNCVYFNQADGRWANHPYAGSTSYWAACGPTSMAMVISTLTGKSISPPNMMDIATKSGYACNGSGSYHTIVPGLAKQFGLKCSGIGNDASKLKKALENGHLVVALMGKGDFTKNGHFIVLRGITSSGKVLVNDPSSNRRTNLEWDFYKFPQQSIKWAAAGGPFWVITK